MITKLFEHLNRRMAKIKTEKQYKAACARIEEMLQDGTQIFFSQKNIPLISPF